MMVRERWKRWLLWGIFWTLVGIFFAHQLYMLPPEIFISKRVTWNEALCVNLPFYYLWAGLCPLVVWLTRRFPLDPPVRWRNVALHVASALWLSALQLGLFVAMLPAIVGEPWSRGFGSSLYYIFIANYHMNVLTYAAIVAAVLMVGWYRRMRDREVRAHQLETRLSQAELAALKMQLQPHFLFNTLNAISALVEQDPEAAERMIARLSRFLRCTLEGGSQPEVSLRQELDFLRCYLDIEEVRFRDRLRVEMRVAPETLDAAVPNLILQPIVENAIRHGIATRSEAGRLEIRAERTNGRLLLAVRDDGPGIRGDGLKLCDGGGVGLRNTKARLEQLYGTDFRFDLKNVPEGGCEVSLDIPWQAAEEGCCGDDAPGPAGR